jgi:hypothetical protein
LRSWHWQALVNVAGDWRFGQEIRSQKQESEMRNLVYAAMAAFALQTPAAMA